LQKRRLGQTELELSVVGLGTVKFGRNQEVKYPSAFELPSDKAILDLLQLAAELGINFLDTAPAYGLSEERLGKCLQGQRHRWLIGTKAGEEFVDGTSHYDFSPQAITSSVHRSLMRLKTDYLDLVLIHSNGEDEKIIQQDNVFLTLDALKQAGKIRAYGMSTKTITGGKLALQHADAAMVTYNPSYTDELELINLAQQSQKGILIKKAFASGHLQKVGEPSQALEFILKEPGVTSVIIGTINPLHLSANLKNIN